MAPERCEPSVKKIRPPDFLKPALKEYSKNLNDSESASNFWHAFWMKNAGIIIPALPKEFMISDQLEGGVLPIYLPSQFATREGRFPLGKMFPRMHNLSTDPDNYVKNVIDRGGWSLFDMQFNAPNRNTTEWQLRNLLKSDSNKQIPTLNQYIIASQASKLLTGGYLDQEGTWSRILGSTNKNEVSYARFKTDGRLDVFFVSPDERHLKVGGRFSYLLK